MERKLTDDQLLAIGWRIIDWFYDSKANSGGRLFGWDWSTMRVIWPAKCSVFRRLRAEWQRRYPKVANA